MVAEQVFVIQIEIVVPKRAVPAQRGVEGGVQVKIPPIQPKNIPSMAVLDTSVRRRFGDRDDTPHTQRVAQDLDRLGDPLTHSHALAQRSDDLVGIGLLQLVVVHIPADEVVDILFFLRRGQGHSRADQLVDPGGEGLLMLAHLTLAEPIVRQQLHIGGPRDKAVGKPGDVKDVRAVQTQLEKDVAQPAAIQTRDRKGGAQLGKSGFHCVVDALPGPVHLLIIIGFHSDPPQYGLAPVYLIPPQKATMNFAVPRRCTRSRFSTWLEHESCGPCPAAGNCPASAEAAVGPGSCRS